MKKQTITLHPAQKKNGVLPYPYFIDKKGMVGRQDFWKGSPLKLIGFNGNPETGHDSKTIDVKIFLKDPQKAVGLYPIFEHKDGEWFTYSDKITRVTIKK